MTNEFTFTADYNADMHRHIDALFTSAKTLCTTRSDRLLASDDLVEAYVAHTGRRPDGTALERLASLILRDELTDTDAHKVTREPEPILSPTQLRRRKISEVLTDFSDEGNDDDSSDVHNRLNQHLASDGRSYRKPIRRTRSAWELIRMDKAKKR